MEYRRLGKAGVKVSALSLGCNPFGTSLDEKSTKRIVHYAIDRGINFFDTSNIYGEGLSEEYLGKALKEKRSQVVIATKFGAGGPNPKYPSKSNYMRGPNDCGGSRYHIMKAIDDSLRRLQTDHIDLYQMHIPDPLTPIDETLTALDHLVRMGKVIYIGCSNFKAHQLYEAVETSRRLNLQSFVTAQELYNAIDRGIENELVPCYQIYGIGLIPFRPLRIGFLTGKYRRGEGVPQGSRFDGRTEVMKKEGGEDFLSNRSFDILEKLKNFAKERQHTVGELAIAWLISHDWVTTVLAGSVKEEQIEANLKSIEWKLTQDEITQIDAITQGS